jgi:hypothetical protein
VVPFAREDLGRAFDGKTVQRATALVLASAVRLKPVPGIITADVVELGHTFHVEVTPVQRGTRVGFERRCSCGRPACAHMAAAAITALDTRPEWRRPVQIDLFEGPDESAPGAAAAKPAPKPGAKPVPTPPAPATPPATATLPTIASSGAAVGTVPRILARWTIEPGRDDAALFVSVHLVPMAGGREAGEAVAATPRQVLERVSRGSAGEPDRTVARLLGGGGSVRTPVTRSQPAMVDRMLAGLLATGRLTWHTGTPLVQGMKRVMRAFRDPRTRKIRTTGLADGAELIVGTRSWLADPQAGRLSPVEFQVVEAPAAAPMAVARPQRPLAGGRPAPGRPAAAAAAAERPTPGFRPPPPPLPPSRTTSDAPEIIERSPRIVARLGRVVTPSDGLVDVVRLSFDYGEPGRPAEIDSDDQRQFAKLEPVDDEPSVFVRRDKDAEQTALDRLASSGFAQLRIEPPRGTLNARGTRVHWLAGRDPEAGWRDFMQREVPAMQAAGWSVEVGADFGTRVIEPDRELDVAVRDAGDGWFDLDIGVDIDGRRQPLLPILAKLIARGGLSAARVIDGRAHIVLDDGTVLSVPADRVERLLSVLEAMLESGRGTGDRMQVPLEEADALLDIDDLVARRPDETRQIDAFLRTLREAAEPSRMAPPPGFQGELRAYQEVGLGWLQQMRIGGMGGILADDMGLGKTAQTLAHIALEEAEGRLDVPALVVVPTSLVPNWVSEAARFTPHLKVVVLHGNDRHERRSDIAGAHIVVTTYGVVVRDVELLAVCRWHLVVLDEAQAIKNPDSKTTRAVCGLNSRHRLCLSGTPVENNLGELWSQFAFLMPSLLGDRKDFQKRFRTPIEKRGDATRAHLLLRRTRPFLLRRTKSEVARELPPKTEIVQRIELAPEQRDLYETIRLSLHEKVRAAVAATGLARNTITVLDALLKLRQVCCDPRLVKLAGATRTPDASSAKLETLVEMVREMVVEGRRILIFSQFTSMLDLIKIELNACGIVFVELTGKTRDRAEPVNRFQSGEIPVFLISLKAGGRGLNLTAADTVFHYDPWWNPAAENQATDRAYRIGQDKPVFVYKLIAAGTVEERILELQRRKDNLTAATIDGTVLAGALDDGDIDYLFSETPEPT